MVRAAYNFGIEYCLRTDYGQVFRVSGIGRSGKVGKYEYFGAVFFMPIALFVGALIFRRRVTLNEKSPWSYSRNKTKGENFKISVTEAESRYKYFNYGTAAVAFGDRQRSLAHHLEPFADIP